MAQAFCHIFVSEPASVLKIVFVGQGIVEQQREKRGLGMRFYADSGTSIKGKYTKNSKHAFTVPMMDWS